MIRTYVLLFGITILLTTCSTNQGDIFEDIEHVCQGDVDEFSMKDVVLSDWDRGCYFDNGISKNEAENILGVKIIGSQEFVSRLVFLNGNSVVGYDEQSYKPSRSVEHGVMFKYDRKSHPGYFCFDKQNSVFESTKEEIDGSTFYVLRIKSLPQ